MRHHYLEIEPIPKGKALFINEPWLTDASYSESLPLNKEPEAQPDNVRIYVPLDLNKEAILRRLADIVCRFGEATEKNESDYQYAVNMLVWQIEIYDQFWLTHQSQPTGSHSKEAVDLVQSFLNELKLIPDGCAEIFPFETIDELTKEYLCSA